MRRLFVVPCAILIASTASAVSATPLLPGQAVVLTGVTAPNGTIVAQTTQPLNFGNATLTSTVLRDASTAKLDFLYTIDGALAQNILSVAVTGFGGVSTDVEFVTGSGDLFPSQSQRLVDGQTITFSGWSATGGTGASLFVDTDADDYDLGNYQILFPGEGTLRTDEAPLDTTITLNLPVYTASGVGPPVPEPATLTLLPLAVMGLIVRKRRS
jgi:hypothetical protein